MAVRRVYKPIWGFGWVGWLALGIAVSMALVLITGYDARYQLQRLVMAVFGVDVMMYATASLYFYEISMFGAGAGPVPVVLALLTIQSCSRRVSRWQVAGLLALAFVWPAAPTVSSYLAHELSVPMPPIERWFFQWGEAVSMIGFAVVMVVGTRSWLVAVASLIAVGAAFLGDAVLGFLFSDAAKA